MSTERFDVVVVGARCAGAATALLMARHGLRVLVLDRARRGTDTLSTHALMRGGAAHLQRWGLLDRIAAAGTPPIRQTRFHYPGETTVVSIRAAAGVDTLYAPRRTLLDTILVDAAIAAGADVRFGATVTELCHDRDGRVTGVIARTRTGKRLHAESWLTVGADGVRSLVARQAQAPTLWTGSGAGAVIYGYWPGLDATGYEWFYRPGATAGMIPTNGGEVCVFAGTSAERFGREFSQNLRKAYRLLLAEATGCDTRLEEADLPPRLHGFPGRHGFLRDGAGPGWALAGDAGGFLDPLSTHGMTGALRDAHLLGQAVGAILRGFPEEESLDAYRAKREQVAIPLFSAVDRIAGYGWDERTVHALLRDLSSAMSSEIEAISHHPPLSQ